MIFLSVTNLSPSFCNGNMELPTHFVSTIQISIIQNFVSVPKNGFRQSSELRRSVPRFIYISIILTDTI
jgi:hypothetical protein